MPPANPVTSATGQPAYPSARRWLAGVSALLASIVRASGRVQIYSLAASLAFLSMTAIVPVATVTLLVMASVPAFAGMRDQLQGFLAANLLLPQVADQVMGHINAFAAAAGRLSVVGIVAFIGTAFTTMLTVDHALNEIWESPEPRPMVYRLLIYWAALTLGPVVMAAVVAMRIEDALSSVGGGLLGAPTWLPWLLITLLLSLIFQVLPNRRVRWFHALAGGAVTALLLEALKAGLQFYITHFPTYEAVYGAFSVVPVFLLWLYIAWLAFLLGALVAANLGYPQVSSARNPSPGEEFERGSAVLTALATAARRGRGIAAGDLARLMDRDPVTAARVAQGLVSLGYMVRVAPGAVARTAVDVSESEEIDHGLRAAREVWAETWMATPALPTLSLRPLRDAIWSRGRLEAAALPAPPRFLPWLRRRKVASAPALTLPPEEAWLDRPLGERHGEERKDHERQASGMQAFEKQGSGKQGPDKERRVA